jgi:PKD repeat protein
MSRIQHLPVWQILMTLVLALLSLASFAGCSGLQSKPPALAPLGQRPTAPQLRIALDRLLADMQIDPARVPARAPQADSTVFDLAVQAGSGAILSWTELLSGDYNADGLVNVSDLTPLSAFFGETVLYDDPLLHDGFAYWPSGDANNTGGPLAPGQWPPRGTGAWNWRMARIDGDRNGLINISDLTPLGNHLNEGLSGYRVYRRHAGEAEWTLLNDPLIPGSALTLPRGAVEPTLPVRHSFSDPAGELTSEYRVVPYDVRSNSEGTLSAASSVQQGVAGAPVAVLTADVTAGVAPLTVTFDSSASSDTNGTIVKHELDFEGDGSFDASQAASFVAVQHTFTATGRYDARLRVTDSNGNTGVVSLGIVIGSIPSAQLTATPDNGEAPLEVTLDASGSSDPAGEALIFEWDLDGDGAYELGTGVEGLLTHAFNQAGHRTVRVRTTNLNGLQDEASATLSLTDDYAEVEPNDTFALATFVGSVDGSAPSLWRGHLGFPGYDGFGEDWLKFNLAQGLQAEIALLFNPLASDLTLRLVANDGKTFLASGDDFPGGELLTHREVVGSDYHLRLRLADLAAAAADYTVSVVTSPLTFDDVEPNDSSATPQLINPPLAHLANGTYDYYGQLNGADMEDWYAWTLLPQPDNAYTLTATLRFAHSNSDVDLEWQYFDADIENDFAIWRRSFGNSNVEAVTGSTPTAGGDGFDVVQQYMRVMNYGKSATIYHLRIEVTQN